MIIEALVHYFRTYGFRADVLPGRIVISLEHNGRIYGQNWAVDPLMIRDASAHRYLLLRAGEIAWEIRNAAGMV